MPPSWCSTVAAVNMCVARVPGAGSAKAGRTTLDAMAATLLRARRSSNTRSSARRRARMAACSCVSPGGVCPGASTCIGDSKASRELRTSPAAAVPSASTCLTASSSLRVGSRALRQPDLHRAASGAERDADAAPGRDYATTTPPK